MKKKTFKIQKLNFEKINKNSTDIKIIKNMDAKINEANIYA